MAQDPVTEAGILRAIQLHVGRHPQAYIIRRTVGRFWTDKGVPVRVGVAGEPDLQGIVGGQVCNNCGCPVHPLPFGIEVKTAKGRQSTGQLNYQNNVWERRGGLYILARSVTDVAKRLHL